MDIRLLGLNNANPYYNSTMQNNNSSVAFKSKGWPSDFPRRLAASADGFTASNVIENELPGLIISSGDRRALDKLINSMLEIISTSQKKYEALASKFREVQDTNVRLRKRTRR